MADYSPSVEPLTPIDGTRPDSSASQQIRRSSVDWRSVPWLAVVLLAAFVFAALFAPVLTSHDPTAIALRERLQPPSSEHWLGTDTLGRDYLTRLLYGARISMIVVVAAVLGAGVLGLVVAVAAGFMGGWVDAILMRLTDAFLGLPTLLVAMVFVFTIGGGLMTVIVALSIVGWSRFARIVRSEVLSVREREFVALARIAGAGQVRIMLRHVLPNVFNTWIVLVTLQCGDFVLSEASLSFLGAGVPPPTPTWGNMISEGLNYLTTAWWLAVIPGVALVLLVYSINVLGDWLRDVLDPKQKQV